MTLNPVDEWIRILGLRSDGALARFVGADRARVPGWRREGMPPHIVLELAIRARSRGSDVPLPLLRAYKRRARKSVGTPGRGAVDGEGTNLPSIGRGARAGQDQASP